MAVRGRPSKGVERSNILLRVPTDLIEQVDAFKESLEAERGGFGINRTDMLIRLIEVGLQTLTQARQPASHPNGQEAPTPQPTAQPAIPLALEPAPKTAHPVDVPQASEAPTESPNGEVDVPPYDTSKYVLGKLCPRGHDYHGTGQSLRHLRRHVCLECDAEAARERRKAKRQRQPA